MGRILVEEVCTPHTQAVGGRPLPAEGRLLPVGDRFLPVGDRLLPVGDRPLPVGGMLPSVCLWRGNR